MDDVYTESALARVARREAIRQRHAALEEENDRKVAAVGEELVCIMASRVKLFYHEILEKEAEGYVMLGMPLLTNNNTHVCHMRKVRKENAL